MRSQRELLRLFVSSTAGERVRDTLVDQFGGEVDQAEKTLGIALESFESALERAQQQTVNNEALGQVAIDLADAAVAGAALLEHMAKDEGRAGFRSQGVTVPAMVDTLRTTARAVRYATTMKG